MRNKGFAAILVLIILAAIGIAGYFAYQRGYFSKTSYPTSSPEPTIETEQAEEPVFGYAGRDPSGPRFIFIVPGDCVEGDNRVACITDEFSIKVVLKFPAIGLGPNVSIPKKSTITSGDYEWEKRVFVPENFALYDLTYQDTYSYSIIVEYFPYSAAAENYFEEKVLPTFQFIK